MGAARVEVPQQSTVPLLERLARLLGIVPLGVDEIGDDQFDGALGASVRVGRANWAVLRDGDHVGDTSGIAVDRGGRREHNVRHIVLGHAPEEDNGASYIDAVVFERLLAGFAHSLGQGQSGILSWGPRTYLQSGKVDDAVNFGVCGKDLV